MYRGAWECVFFMEWFKVSFQQVNLYVDELRPQKTWLTAETLGASFIGICLILFYFGFEVTTSVNKLERKVIELENQKVVIQDQLTKIKDMAKASNKSELDMHIAELKAFLTERRQLRRLLSNKNMGNKNGFSILLNGLAENSNSDLALEKIRLTSGGAFIELSGHSRSPEAVPHYIKNLQDDDNFKGARFGSINLVDSESRKFYDFSLGFDSVQTGSNTVGTR